MNTRDFLWMLVFLVAFFVAGYTCPFGRTRQPAHVHSLPVPAQSVTMKWGYPAYAPGVSPDPYLESIAGKTTHGMIPEHARPATCAEMDSAYAAERAAPKRTVLDTLRTPHHITIRDCAFYVLDSTGVNIDSIPVPSRSVVARKVFVIQNRVWIEVERWPAHPKHAVTVCWDSMMDVSGASLARRGDLLTRLRRSAKESAELAGGARR